MKKLIFSLFLILSLFEGVNAQSYYSDYSDYSDYSLEKIEASDVIDVASDNFYHAYKEVEESYIFDDLSYEIKDDSIIEYDEYVNDLTRLDGIHQYEEKNRYLYNEFKNYNYIYFNNIGSEPIVIDKLEFIDKVNKNILFEFCNFKVNVRDIFIIDLFTLEDLVIQNLELNIIMDNPENTLSVYLSNYPYPDIDNDRYYLSLNRDLENSNLYTFNNFTDIECMFNNEIREALDENFSGKVVVVQKLYRNYKIFNTGIKYNREYLDLYTNTLDDEYKLDYEDYITKYRYRTRDKVEILDDITIDNYDVNLYDYISYSSLDENDIKFTSNVNLSENGVYEVNYILPFKTISKEIKVDIKDNYINLIKKQEEYINNMIDLVDASVYMVDKKNYEIKEIIKNSEEEKNELKEEIISCKAKINDDKSIVLDSDNENKQVKYLNTIWLILFLLILIVISNVVEKRRLKRKSTFVDIE